MSVERDFASRASSLSSPLVVNPSHTGSMAQYYQKQFLSLRGVPVCVGRGNDAVSDRGARAHHLPRGRGPSVAFVRECATSTVTALLYAVTWYGRQTDFLSNKLTYMRSPNGRTVVQGLIAISNEQWGKSHRGSRFRLVSASVGDWPPVRKLLTVKVDDSAANGKDARCVARAMPTSRKSPRLARAYISLREGRNYVLLTRRAIVTVTVRFAGCKVPSLVSI